MSDVTVNFGGQPIDISLPENAAEAKRQAVLSQLWAEGTLPGGAGTKSAKEQALASATSAATSTAQAAIATAAKNDTLAIAGTKGIFATKADANAGLDALADGSIALVQADETNGGVAWYYLKSGGVYVSKGAAINRGPSTVRRATLVNNSGGTRVLDVLPPPSAMIDSSGLNNAVGLKIINNSGQSTNGPAGRTTYFNTTFRIGLNLTDGYLNENLSMAAPFIGLENLYYLPGLRFVTETHLGTVTKDDRQEKRHISFVSPEVSTDWAEYSSGGFRSAIWSFSDGENNQRFVVDLRPAVNQLQLGRGTVGGVLRDAPQIAFDQNNRAPIILKNAAGSAFVEPFRFTVGDRLQFNQPRTEQITANANGVLGVGLVNVERQFLGAAAGSIGQYTTWNAVTGAFTGESWAGSATGLLHFPKRNTASGGQIGQTLIHNGGVGFISFENTAAGSVGPQIRFDTVTDSLQIHAEGYRGGAATKGAMTIPRATGQVQFATAPRLVSSTVAALPAAATAGAGSLQYVTNLNATTAGTVAAGGGSNKGMVVCDGTDWRIMAAWS